MAQEYFELPVFDRNGREMRQTATLKGDLVLLGREYRFLLSEGFNVELSHAGIDFATNLRNLETNIRNIQREVERQEEEEERQEMIRVENEKMSRFSKYFDRVMEKYESRNEPLPYSIRMYLKSKLMQKYIHDTRREYQIVADMLSDLEE